MLKVLGQGVLVQAECLTRSFLNSQLVHISWRTDLHLDLREFQQEVPPMRATQTHCSNP